MITIWISGNTIAIELVADWIFTRVRRARVSSTENVSISLFLPIRFVDPTIVSELLPGVFAFALS